MNKCVSNVLLRDSLTFISVKVQTYVIGVRRRYVKAHGQQQLAVQRSEITCKNHEGCSYRYCLYGTQWSHLSKQRGAKI